MIFVFQSYLFRVLNNLSARLQILNPKFTPVEVRFKVMEPKWVAVHSINYSVNSRFSLVSWDYLPNSLTGESKYTTMTKNVDTTLCNHYITSFCIAAIQISRANIAEMLKIWKYVCITVFANIGHNSRQYV